MQERVEQFLVQTTNATAANNGLIFKNIQTETSNAAKYTENIFNNPANFPTSNWRFDQHIVRKSAGQYTNNADTDASAVFIQNYIPVTPLLKQQLELTSYLDYLLPQTITAEPNAVAIYYIGTQGETRYYPNFDIGSAIPPDYNPTADPFYTPALPQNNPGKVTKWSKVYDDPAGNGLLITASNPVYTKASFTGIIGTDVSLNDIAKNIEGYSPIESSYAFLVDNEGRAVALPGKGYQDLLSRNAKKDEFGPDLKTVKGDFANIIKEMQAGKSGFRTAQGSSKTLYVAYEPVKGTPFSLAIVADQAVMLKVVADLRGQVNSFTQQVMYYQILPIAIIILLLVWVSGFFYIRLITAPIIALTERTRRIMQGDFTSVPIVSTSDEVGKLTSAFTTMASRLAESYRALEHKVHDRTKALNQKVQELSNAKAKDDAILSSIGEGMIVTDAHGVILLTNATASQLLNIDDDTAEGKKITDYELYDEENAKLPLKEHPVNAALESGKKVNKEVRVAASGDSKRALSITATPVQQNDKIIGVIQIIRDVTKEKEVDRMKTEFISIASHQLRTPLSAIKWFSELLLGGDMGKMTTEQHQQVQNIAESTARMVELVNSLLNISRLESGRIIVDPKPTDLKELVSAIVNDLKGKIEERHQTLTFNIDKALPTINVDPSLTRQVYLNLLTNAIKYTPKGGKITVTINRKGKDIVTCVADTGYGIPKSEQQKVFQKFFRATNIVKVEADGTGLGMYLIRSIVTMSDGKIWFESVEGKGTTFWFTLPVKGVKAKSGEVVIG